MSLVVENPQLEIIMQKPKGSEIPAKEWLKQIGSTEIEYVGDGEGPPDYICKYKGDLIAIEVRLLDSLLGWPANKEQAFKKELEEFTMNIMSGENTPKWNVFVEYDPNDQPPKKGDVFWRNKIQKALNSTHMAVDIQLLPSEKIKGKGILFTLRRSVNQGRFDWLGKDIGSIPEIVLSKRITACVKEKSEKVIKGTRAHQYDKWWLFLDDEVLIVPREILYQKEQDRIKEMVHACEGREQWSKIILVSRFQPEGSPKTQEKWFWPVWEDPRYALLPKSFVPSNITLPH